VSAEVKTIAVIVRARGGERVAEALRAAVGLGLRGDRVVVCAALGRGGVGVEGGAAGGGAERGAAGADIARAAATLRALGQVVRGGGDEEVAATVRAADVVEVWT
jgi:hypothetical protein